MTGFADPEVSLPLRDLAMGGSFPTGAGHFFLPGAWQIERIDLRRRDFISGTVQMIIDRVQRLHWRRRCVASDRA